MKTGATAVLLVLTAACLDPVREGADGGAGGGGGHVIGTLPDASTVRRCRDYGSYGQVCADVPTTVMCGGQACAPGEECCVTNNRCVPSNASSDACPRLPTTWPYESSPRACSLSSDCGADEFCMVDDQTRCGGSGHCQPITNCGFCGAPGSNRCEVCGCDGRTWASMQEACVAGVNFATSGGPCGELLVPGNGNSASCGRDDQCAAGFKCCAVTGRCFDVTQPWRCELLPDAGLRDCLTVTECGVTRGPAGGGPGSPSDSYLCLRSGCTEPGTCRMRPMNCGGNVLTVCGCDGVDYVNECWAWAAGTTVASVGPCP